MKITNNKGFQLVEIVIVVVIIGLLAAMAIPAIQKIRKNNIENTVEVEKNKLVYPSFVVIKQINAKGNRFSIVEHKETGVLYVCNSNVFTPLLDKDGKPLVKY